MLQIDCGGALARMHVCGSAVCLPAPSCFLILIILSIAHVGAFLYVQDSSPHHSATTGEVLLCGIYSHVLYPHLWHTPLSWPWGFSFVVYRLVG